MLSSKMAGSQNNAAALPEDRFALAMSWRVTVPKAPITTQLPQHRYCSAGLAKAATIDVGLGVKNILKSTLGLIMRLVGAILIELSFALAK